MKEKILNNITLKLLAVIFSIVIWILIVNSYDPYSSVTFSGISVTLENGDVLTDMGYTYSVLDGSRISVTLSGPSSKVTALNSSNVIATADLSTLRDNSDYVDITVRVVRNGRAVEDITATPSQTSVRLGIENRSTQTFDIQLTTVGEPESDYAILNGSITPSTVTISGASTDVENIALVSAVYDVSGLNHDIDDTAAIMLYDSSGNTISTDNLSLSTRQVHYTADVSLSKEVPLILTTSGKPAAGYKVNQISPDSDTITISGDSEVISSISEIAIPSDALNVEGLSDSTTFRLWLEDYLPDNISLVSDSMVSVRVEIEPEATGTVTLPSSAVTAVNVPDGLSAQVSGRDLTVQVEGSQSVISSLTAEGLSATVNAAGLSAGTQSVTVDFSPPSGAAVTGEYQMTLTLTRQTTTTAAATESRHSTDTDSTQAQADSEGILSEN
ncbi:MAG: CdaR family protein [Lachnospiraceae bacterium]|jgi:YbbR domain-containing protein|nr:CdaR family protein [Lachnospiraceae bacterium]MCH4030231.1 CdaR family protein [Lachnospiraceae bacterium]MCH4069443.1 CdaR family protein [Lachnospiraceae bacterium]MCH4107621.1 CdaR family protein [Lachnospiraceae bacterium]MCI1301528.1 CdaR family protein [Lachnospiraceae bacterium]